MSSVVPTLVRDPRVGLVLRLLVPAVFVALAFGGLGPHWSRIVVLVCIMALVVSGLNLIFGYAGELNLGQAALYAAGAYATGYLSINVLNDLLFCVLASAATAVVVGILAGVPGLRVGGWVLAIISFFLVLLVEPVVNIIGEPVGGFAGLTGIPLPRLFGIDLTETGYYVATVVLTGAWFWFFRNLVDSRHGKGLLVLRTSPILASSLGIAPYAMKIKVYVLSSIPTGMAGALFAYLDGFIAPESFGLDLSVTLLAAAILGGATSVYGALVGAAFLVIGPSELSIFEEYNLVAYGVLLVLGGLLFNDGLAGVARRLFRRLRPATGARPELDQAHEPRLEPVSGHRLVVEGASRSFGGLKALSDVSITAEPGAVTALIGPNGSGKTTLVNLISGYYAPDRGRILIGDTDATDLPVHKVSRLGVGRTFQTPIIPEGLTVREVVAAANLVREPTSMLSSALRLGGYRRGRRSDARLDSLLDALGLGPVADQPASSLALGTRRMVELARAIAGGNQLILLDEVAAGLDGNEIDELAAVIRALRRSGATVLLIEHNFSFVKENADHVLVLADGGLVASGTPAAISDDPEVRRRYLGEGAELTGTRGRRTQPAEGGER
ncbi:MAG: branched-chain amino acid transporter substrate-binding protein [Rhizobacter sp.]|nr:branched-chain amino acid transporter substrate-binding protein [Rhizobacter sp.]